MSKQLRYTLILLAGVIAMAGFLLMIADSDDFTAFLWTKVYGCLLFVAGLAGIAHLDKKGENQ